MMTQRRWRGIKYPTYSVFSAQQRQQHDGRSAGVIVGRLSGNVSECQDGAMKNLPYLVSILILRNSSWKFLYSSNQNKACFGERNKPLKQSIEML
jgi:hypothetical protein